MDLQSFFDSTNAPLWAIMVGSVLLGCLAAKLTLSIFSVARFFNADEYVQVIKDNLSQVLYVFFPVLVLTISLGFYVDEHPKAFWLFQFSKLTLIALSAITLARIVILVERLILLRLEIDPITSISQRKIYTRIKFVTRLVIMIISTISLALILLSFEKGRQFGVGLLTSAGILSVIIGFAAQKTLGNLLASLQVAFSQPIKIGDTIVVENEVGQVEEINLTYVVVRLWDRRRLILPITYFIDTPFQNWTRNDSSLIGVVLLYLDHRTPMDALRAKFTELVHQHPNWDGDVCELHITDTQMQQMVVRATMSVGSPTESFAIRSFIRENLIAWLRDNHPESLPGMRVISEQKPNLPPEK
jgi:small-conductance mechanosensitive channel